MYIFIEYDKIQNIHKGKTIFVHFFQMSITFPNSGTRHYNIPEKYDELARLLPVSSTEKLTTCILQNPHILEANKKIILKELQDLCVARHQFCGKQALKI